MKVLGFFIWVLISFIFIIIGCVSYFSKKPVGFWANTEAPKVKNIKGYNHSMANIR